MTNRLSKKNRTDHRAIVAAIARVEMDTSTEWLQRPRLVPPQRDPRRNLHRAVVFIARATVVALAEVDPRAVAAAQQAHDRVVARVVVPRPRHRPRPEHLPGPETGGFRLLSALRAHT